MTGTIRVLLAVLPATLAVSLAVVGAGNAERISDIANTKHNFSATSGNAVRATSRDEICIFCHTPHGANTESVAPLWNRATSEATYTPYTSSSLDAIGLDQPGGSSKLCLSCHDGTIAVGSVSVLDGNLTDQNPATEDIPMQGTDPGGTLPAGAGATTGFTRLLGTDLRNDHPISFIYDDSLAGLDGELRFPSSESHLGNRVPGVFPPVPLENGQLQCTSCHDPHIRDTVETDIKFLRLNRFQKSPPLGGAFDIDNDILCVACHDKDGWADSAHAHSQVADEIYQADAANLREFPSGTAVWEAACLNCHDTHTVQGAQRLLREGTDSILSPKSGGNAASEETCYQCHSSTGAVLLNQGTTGFQVPDIKTDFDRLRHMPIDEQPEVHDIGTGGSAQAGADLLESRTLLGLGGSTNRHVECTDCHHPHRMIKNRAFNDDAGIPHTAGTHDHSAGHTNIASGVLRGSWGVEPNYGSTTFMSNPNSYTVKRGNPPPGATTTVSNGYMTREYQVCLKCHSDYGYTTTPDLQCCTPPNTNGLTQYTNQAMEFQAPTSDKGEPGGNHRSWHPVIGETGRSLSVRGGMSASLFLPPWNGQADVGTQTMYCSDCHGSTTQNGTVVPDGNTTGENGNAWGPHGSADDFILKGDWSDNTGTGQQDDLCFKCHSYTLYATRNSTKSGFCCDSGWRDDPNLHGLHASRIRSGIKCMYCHVAVPHGWKNKALLVNLNDVGPEAGLPAGTSVAPDRYSNAPYYQDAFLRILNWKTSGNWLASDCGRSNTDRGRSWMRRTCRSP